MGFYTEEQIEKARSIDLMTYLQSYEPTELVHVAEQLADKYIIRDEPPIYGKDCNDYLQNMIRQKHSRQMGRE